jgi:hypothetical protein
MAKSKLKLKWFREGYDNYEDLFLIPVDQERTEDGDLNIDAAVAWVKISYDRTRFFNGRGGEGTSRPDAYVAYVLGDRAKGQKDRVVVTEGADAVGHVGGLFSDKADKAFRSLRAAKQAISAALAKAARSAEGTGAGVTGKLDAPKSEVATPDAVKEL